MPTFFIVPLVLFIAGALAIAYGVWARAGRTPLARRWLMDTSKTRYTGIDLLTLVVAPGYGLSLCLFGILIALDMTEPPSDYELVPLALFAVSTVAAAGARIRTRVPDALYPRWAREIRVEQRRRRP